MKARHVKQKLFYLGAISLSIFLVLLLVRRVEGSDSFADLANSGEIIQEMIVVAEQSDLYYHLAQKIAQAQKTEIVENVSQALAHNPRFIILVASPKKLTEERLLNIGRMFQKLDYYPALGIISGSTIEKAEQLWARRELVQKGRNYLGSDVEKAHSVQEPVIFDISEGSDAKSELTKNNLIAALAQANYFYWARHVTSNKWFWNTESENYGENDKLYATDLPDMDSVVIYTPSCGSFQPWVDDSIVLGFVDKGAAAYIGHIHSPLTNNFLMRQKLSVPGLNTWKEFPLGIMAQVQNKMTARTAHKTPLYFMLGDPRIYLSKDTPYQINLDTVDEKGNREIAGESSKKGVLAVKIDRGAEYAYLRIVGVAAASDNDLFYNNNLQMLNLGTDKYVLFFHQGGEFEIKLGRKAPLLWTITDAAIDALDYSWVALGIVYSPLAFVLLTIFLAILLPKMLRKKRSITYYRTEFLVGSLFVAVRLVYLLVRVDDYSVSSNMASYTVLRISLGCVGIFAGVAGGLILVKDAKRPIVKMLGLLLAVLPQFLLTGFYFANITITNVMFRAKNSTPLWLWNYNAFWVPLSVLVLEFFVIFALYRYNNRKHSRQV